MQNNRLVRDVDILIIPMINQLLSKFKFNFACVLIRKRTSFTDWNNNISISSRKFNGKTKEYTKEPLNY